MTFAIQQASPFGAFRESPLHARGAGENLCFVSLSNDTVHRINPTDGTTIWSASVTGAGRLAVSSDRRLFILGSAAIVELNIDTGASVNSQALTMNGASLGAGQVNELYVDGRTSGIPAGITKRQFDLATETWKYTGEPRSANLTIPIGSDGDIYLAAALSRNTIGANPALVRLDSSGSVVWTKNYDYDVAGTFDEFACELDIYGDYLFNAGYNDDATYSAGKGYYLYKRLRSDGSRVDSVTGFAGGNFRKTHQCAGFRISQGGIIYVTGLLRTLQSELLSYNQSLVLQNSFKVSAFGPRAFGVDVDGSGNVYVASTRVSDWAGTDGSYSHLFKLDGDLNLLWTRDFGAAVSSAYRVCGGYHQPR